MCHGNAPWINKTDLTEKCNKFQDRMRMMYFLGSEIPDIYNYLMIILIKMNLFRFMLGQTIRWQLYFWTNNYLHCHLYFYSMVLFTQCILKL